jgi:hypothetical protein
MGGYVAAAQLGYGLYQDAQARSDANQARRQSQSAQEQMFPYELQQIRQNFGDSANQLAPYLLNGGFGNYANYNPYMQGQSPFAQYGQPQQQTRYTPYENGGRSFNNSPNQGQPQINSPYQDVGRLERPQQPDYMDAVVANNAQNNPNRFRNVSTGAIGGDASLPDTRFTQGYVQGQDYGNPNSLAQGVNSPNQLPYQLPNGQLSQLELLNQASQLNYNPQIDQLVGQQGQNIQNAQPLNLANLQQFQNQLGGINNQSQNSLAQLIQQLQGNNQNIQSLYGQQAGQQLSGQNPQALAFQNLLNQGQNFAQGGQDTSGFNPYAQAVGGALSNNLGQINGVDQQTQALIDANNKASTFQQDKAIQDLNDQLSARGLSNSQAGLEAISGANAQFARQRAGDEAKFRQDALNQAFAQRQSGNALQGQLAGQGANILSQQGQLGNADLNARIRALDTSGQLASGAGANQSRGISDLIQLLNANQQGVSGVNALQNQANQQNAGFAQTNYGLNQQAINSNQDSLNQLLALYQGNENRNLGLGQQAFANRGAVYDRGMGFLTNAFNAGQQGALGSAQIGANQAQMNFQQAQANRAGAGQLIGQGVNTLVDAYSHQAPPQTTYNPPPRVVNTPSQYNDYQAGNGYQDPNGFYATEQFDPYRNY